MYNIKEVTSNIEVSSLVSDDGKYRFMLTRKWNDNKKTATVIGINPSKATHLKGDNTATNAMNYLIDNDFGEMVIVNLYPYRCVNPKELKNRDKLYDKINLEYVKKACQSTDMILLACGHAKDEYITAKKSILELLEPYKGIVKCFKDEDGNKPKHLRIFSENWVLENYF